MKFEIEVQQFVAIGFYESDINSDGSVKWSSKRQIKIIDIPRTLYQNQITKNRINWILSRYRYLNPKKWIDTAYQYYDKKTGIDLDIKSAYSRVSSCKSTLTKWEKKLNEYIKNWQPSLIVQNIQEDDNYKNALIKLENKKCELRNAEQDLAKELLEKQSTL